MTEALPPMGGTRPAMDTSCARLVPGGHCGRPSTMHVAWTADMENGVMCDEHWAEAQRLWVYYDHHPIGPFCTMPDSLWVRSWLQPPGDCAIEVEPETVALMQAAKAVPR